MILTEQILKKPPKFSDVTFLFIPFAHQYHIIGSALNVGIEDLMTSPLAAEFKVILLFHRWIASNKEVTWKKIIQVCQYYPAELGKAEAEIITFLSSEHACESTTTTSSSFPSEFVNFCNIPVPKLFTNYYYLIFEIV